MSPAALLASLAALSTTPSDTAWSRFRGPNGTGVHPTATLPASIGPDSEDLRWRVELPPGYSSPVLTEDLVVVTGHEGCFLFTVAVDRKTGRVRWRRECPTALERPHRSVNTPCSPTAVTDGENVIVYLPAFGLLSYDPQGKERWRVPLDELNIVYKPGTSPILHDGTLLLQADQDTGSYLLALDAETGEERWRAERPGVTHGFSSPVVYAPEEGPTEVIVSGSYRVTGYDLSTGDERWFVSGMAWQAKSLPIVVGDRLYVHSWMAAPSELGTKKLTRTWAEAAAELDANEDALISKEEADPLGLERVWMLYDMDKDDAMDEEEWGYALARATAKNGLHAIRLGGTGDVTETHVEWTWKRSLPNVPSPILVDGTLFVLKEGGVLTALDPKNGETLLAGRVNEDAEEGYYASPVAAGSTLLLASHPGKVARVATGDAWEVSEITDFGEEIWATPAVAEDGVYLRTQAALYAFGKLAADDE